MSELDFIYKRHSVRKFKEQAVPLEDIKEIIKAATYAPSGKNLQNWHFVVVRNKEKIEQMAALIEKKAYKIAESLKEDALKKRFLRSLDYTTLFKNAPVTILIYAGPYPITGEKILTTIRCSGRRNKSTTQTGSGHPKHRCGDRKSSCWPLLIWAMEPAG
ncbi:MAG: nitroreductase family protein [Peptococcia bacterium]